MSATRTPLSDHRWHLQHGPIDIVLHADGDAAAVAAAHGAAWHRFGSVLAELVTELPQLRTAMEPGCRAPAGAVAARMHRACAPLARRRDGRPVFLTPMAAVAGAVADELIAHYRRPGVQRAWVNNGGDIAWHLAPGTTLRVGLVADASQATFVMNADGSEQPGGTDRGHRAVAAADAGEAHGIPRAAAGSGNSPSSAPWRLQPDGAFRVTAAQPTRGLATSGWRGRSHSLGIADSVTVLASSAAQADAAATLVANAVDVDDRRIARRPACTLKDDSDLGHRLVTTHVPPLDAAAVHAALAQGRAVAVELVERGLIAAAVLVCQGRAVTVGRLDAPAMQPPESRRSARGRSGPCVSAPMPHAMTSDPHPRPHTTRPRP